jgi:glycosidase
MASYKEINAAAQVGVKGSVFEYWSSILRLRKTYLNIFIYGKFEMVDKDHDKVFAYIRTYYDQRIIVVANMWKTPIKWVIPRELVLVGDCLVSNYEGIKERDGVVELSAFEAFACFLK